MNIEDLKKHQIRKLLEIQIGAYNLYSFFFNWYIADKIFLNDPKKIINKTTKGHPSLFMKIKHLFLSYIRFFTFLNKKKPLKKVDILFLSRYREKNGEDIKTDYLFDSVLNFTENKYDSALISFNYDDHYNRALTENYNLRDGITFFILLKSVILSLKVFIKYIFIKSQLEESTKNVFKSFFSFNRLFYCCLMDLSLNNLFESIKPELIVVNDDLQLIKPLGKDIPFITVQSGTMSDKIEKIRHQLYSIFVDDKRKSDIFCASGPIYKLIKEKYPCDVKKIIITGQSRFDKLIQLVGRSQKGLKTQNKKIGDKINILWTTQSHVICQEENEKNIIAINKLLSKNENVRLNIKLHPGEDQEAILYQDLQEQFNNVNILRKDSDFYQSLINCDVLLTKTSTTIIEAAISKKDILILDLLNNHEEKGYERKDMAFWVYDENYLESALKDLFDNEILIKKIKESRERFIYQHNYLNDGNASRRIFRVIENVLESDINQVY